MAEDEPAISDMVLRSARLPADGRLLLLGRLRPSGRAALRWCHDLPDVVRRELAMFEPIDFTLRSSGKGSLSPEAVVIGDEGATPRFHATHRADQASSEPVQPLPSKRIDPIFRFAVHLGDGRGPARPTGTARAGEFRFATDAIGTVRRVEGVRRLALIGLSLAHAGRQGSAQVDAGVAAAVRSRSRFTAQRLEVDGASSAAGSWRITGAPVFDRATGRFTGFHGVARRPFRHEAAGSPPRDPSETSDAPRQLAHEPHISTDAIVGFAELIETEPPGPVPEPHRAHAADIGADAGALIAAVDDLEMAARPEGGALDPSPGRLPLRPLLKRLATDLAPLAAARGAQLMLDLDDGALDVDERAGERVIARLLATLIAAAAPGERLGVIARASGGEATIAIDRPRALADLADDALFSLDEDVRPDPEQAAPLLGASFTLRLVRNLAAELGGALVIGRDRMILRLPAASTGRPDQVSA